MAAQAITFHKMLSGCLEGEFKCWHLFVCSYGSLAQHLIKQHFRAAENCGPELTAEIFGSIRKNDSAFLREFSGSSEREFLLYFERRVFAVARDRLGCDATAADFDFELLRTWFEKMPLAHQEVAWLAMKAYEQGEMGRILRVPVALVRAAEVEVLRKWSQIRDREISAMPFLHDQFHQQIENLKGPNCPPIKIFSDLMDGRIVWRDKQQVENHISECLWCLDRETTLKETLFQLQTLAPLPTESVERLLRDLKIEARPPKAKATLLAKVIRVFK